MNITLELKVDGRSLALDKPEDFETAKSIIDMYQKLKAVSSESAAASQIVSEVVQSNGSSAGHISPQALQRAKEFRKRQEAKKTLNMPPVGERTIDYALKAWFALGKDVVTVTELAEQMLILGWKTNSVMPESVTRHTLVDAKKLFRKLPDTTWQYIGPEQKADQEQKTQNQQGMLLSDKLDAEEKELFAQLQK